MMAGTGQSWLQASLLALNLRCLGMRLCRHQQPQPLQAAPADPPRTCAPGGTCHQCQRGLLVRLDEGVSNLWQGACPHRTKGVYKGPVRGTVHNPTKKWSWCTHDPSPLHSNSADWTDHSCKFANTVTQDRSNNVDTQCGRPRPED